MKVHEIKNMHCLSILFLLLPKGSATGGIPFRCLDFAKYSQIFPQSFPQVRRKTRFAQKPSACAFHATAIAIKPNQKASQAPHLLGEVLAVATCS